MVVVLGYIQLLYINVFDEVIVLLIDFFVCIVCNIQIYIQEEIYICKNVDLWGGFYYVEFLINELVYSVWEYIQEIEKLGGMVKVIEIGILKMCIEEVVVCV